VEALSSHPLKLYYDLGVRVTVNTDNRLITDTSVSKELWLCHKEMGLHARDIARIILNGFKAAFLPFHIKQAYLRRISAELQGFIEDPLSVLPDPQRAAASRSEAPRA
jgi:adenosine deaminase